MGLFLIAVIFWIIPIIIATNMWADKGGEGWVGFIMGLFLGWIGVILAAVATPNAAVVSSSTHTGWGPAALTKEVVRTKTCPRCAEDVKQAAKVCRFCGHEFGEPARSLAPEPEREVFQGGEVTEVTLHAFGVKWGKTPDGDVVFKERDGDPWTIYQEGSSSLVPPRGYS